MFVIYIFIILVCMPLLIYAQERSPFASFLPAERKEEERPEPEYFVPSFAPFFSVEGILWGADKPLTVIDGRVYRVGDRIEGSEAIIQRVEDGAVFILYRGRVNKYGITKKSKKEER